MGENWKWSGVVRLTKFKAEKEMKYDGKKKKKKVLKKN